MHHEIFNLSLEGEEEEEGRGRKLEITKEEIGGDDMEMNKDRTNDFRLMRGSRISMRTKHVMYMV